jgi:hypothetical protein
MKRQLEERDERLTGWSGGAEDAIDFHAAIAAQN